MNSRNPRREPIAVIGASTLMPGSTDAEGFWRTIVNGDDLIREVPQGHWLLSDYYDPDPTAVDRTYGRRGAFLDPVPFDPVAHGLLPNTLRSTDTAQLLTMVVAERLLADIGVSPGERATVDRERISVILGSGPLELASTMSNRMQRPVWTKALREHGLPESEVAQICDRIAAHYVPWQEATFPGLLSNVLAGRVANRFDLHGSNFTADAACAASLAALSTAINELTVGQADLAITGGVDTLNDILMYTCMSKTPALSRTGDCRPFADDADGTIIGEGVVMFALKRLSDAERDADRIYAVITGVGSASDGRSPGIYAPVPDGQLRALRRAYEDAGYDPATVELVEAHGTATPAGDAAEMAALRELFDRSGRGGGRWCALGSVKSQVGHTKATAGAAGLFKIVMALHHRVLPPTIKVNQPHPDLNREDGALYLNTVARPWIRASTHPRRGSVSSFGFGGSNFHITAQEYIPKRAGRHGVSLRAAPTELILLSGDSPVELAGKCREMAAGASGLTTLARDSQESFDASGRARLAVVASDRDDLGAKLSAAADRFDTAPEEPFSLPDSTHYRCGAAEPGRIGLLFPGQGSQYVGMGADLAVHYPQARDVWDRAADIAFGPDRLHEVVFPVPVFTDTDRAAQAARLTATEMTQPAIAAHSMALLAILNCLRLQYDCVAGHSLGELPALFAAGCLDATALLRLTRKRGELMKAAAGDAGASGGMLAVNGSWAQVSAVVEATGRDDLWVVNNNSPQQVVVAGAREPLAKLQEHFAGRRVNTHLLPVSGAFHTPLVAAAAEPLRAFAQDLGVSAPVLDVYGNTDATPYPREPAAIAHRIASQLVSPVRFAEQIDAMYHRGVRIFIEVGPGAVLTGLVGANLRERPHVAVALDRARRHGVTTLQESLAVLSVHGIPLDLGALWTHYARPIDDARLKSPATVMICGANYGKPYPPPNGSVDLPKPNPERHSVMDQDPKAARSGPSTPPPIPQTGPDDARLRTLLEIQRHTAEVQAAYQQAMAQSQLAFLATAGASLRGLESNGHHPDGAGVIALGAPPSFEWGNGHQTASAGAKVSEHAFAEPMQRAPESPIAVPTVPPTSPPPPSASSAPEPAAVPPQPDPWAQQPAATASAVAPPPPTWSSEVEQAVPGTAPAPTHELADLVVEVIAERTGYPTEILTPDMQLGADLGIDSIKRVEIFAAIRSSAADIPDLDTTQLAQLQTVGEVIEGLSAAAAGTGVGQKPPF
ncbi:type I polyketide synthase [Nocardia goodfellowii]|uniref:Polyketide-type polyunsaturated fatty acid synthase PfaA n=1 Tax=Nocardia goodfellowii TaxID=882446 RepID=A0ABS4QKL8_9NOCA|nr:type I polyketide synthase [Nocardia goodfellowii]MBP2191589.1 polyketide-type polyunsaturated fatty acid synthase PfaA [Nocardia goodfellowii]